MPHDSKERYIGDGVYASIDPARMIVLRTTRHPSELDEEACAAERYVSTHWIALEPEVLTELMRFAFDIGWGDLILSIANKQPAKPPQTDEEYAHDQEDQQRKRDAAEGFDD